MKKELILSFFLFISCFGIHAQGWPVADSITKPWTRWWWLGSAVNENGLKYNLQSLKDVGIGGVEITPIYGIKGQEKSFVPFLSDRWIDLFEFALNFTGKNGMGVDLANATGWPFGGPWVSQDDASKTIYKRKYVLEAGQSIDSSLVYKHKGLIRAANTTKRSINDIPKNFLQSPFLQEWALDQIQFAEDLLPETIMAYGPSGATKDLTHLLDRHGRLNWKSPEGTWNVWVLYKSLHGKMVERAAPGGEGYAIDHFSKDAVTRYLQHFTTALAGRDLRGLRGYFNDSYEVDDASGQANWTNNFFEQFQQIKGYDLRAHLPALFGEADIETQRRILFDYRTVIDSMILGNFTETWKKWGSGQGKILRNQSHGSPANTLDLYSAVDIPETEGTDWLRFKFATSAAHVNGKKLVSAEAATWLDEHFLSSWGDVKKALDLYFLAGVNHIVYHGTPYSAPEAPWPGWNFYAAVQFQQTNPQWKHFKQLNEYVTKVQSFLQKARPDHQVLLYYPLHDRYAQTGGQLLQHFDGMEKNFEHTDFEQLAKKLQQTGVGFDFLSDRQLSHVNVRDGMLYTGGNPYRTILVPEIKVMDLPSWEHLLKLASQGATIIFHKELPLELPGLYQLNQRKNGLSALLSGLHWSSRSQGKMALIGKGKLVVSNEWTGILLSAGLSIGKFEQKGLRSYSMVLQDEALSFVVNQTDSARDAWFDLDNFKGQILFFDPMSGKISSAVQKTDPSGKSQFRMLLPPHASLIVKWERSKGSIPAHQYLSIPVEIVPLVKNWQIRFNEGGPTLPKQRSIENGPVYWTSFTDSAALDFSGLATYETNFELTDPNAFHWQLDLGKVAVTAEVWINGRSIGVSIGPHHILDIPKGILKQHNLIKIQVANLMANRIAYMDRHGLPWKIFYNINMSAKSKDNLKNGVFDASHWSTRQSGLNGPVQLLKYRSLE